MKNLITYHSFSLVESNIEQDLGWLDGDGSMGALYDPPTKVMYIGSESDENLNYTITGVETKDQANEIIAILRGIDHKEWGKHLKEVGFEISNGRKYFEITKR